MPAIRAVYRNYRNNRLAGVPRPSEKGTADTERDPRTNMKSAAMMWDFWSLNPESLHQVTMLFSDRGLLRAMRVPGWRLRDRLLRAMRARSRLGVGHLAHPRDACIAPRATHASHPS
jgi:hypothetical protein